MFDGSTEDELAGPASMTVSRAFLASQLRTLLQALAAPGPDALSHAPIGSCRPDELALDFDNYASAFIGNFHGTMTSDQQVRLARVDALLDEMSGEGNSALWTEEAVCTHARWAEVRCAARDALDAFGWPAV